MYRANLLGANKNFAELHCDAVVHPVHWPVILAYSCRLQDFQVTHSAVTGPDRNTQSAQRGARVYPLRSGPVSGVGDRTWQDALSRQGGGTGEPDVGMPTDVR